MRSKWSSLSVVFVDFRGNLLFDLPKWANCFQHPRPMYIHDHLAVSSCDHLLGWHHAFSQNDFPVKLQVPTKEIGSLKSWKWVFLFCRKQCRINTHMASYHSTTCSLFFGQKYPWKGQQWEVEEKILGINRSFETITSCCFYKSEFMHWKKLKIWIAKMQWLF